MAYCTQDDILNEIPRSVLVEISDDQDNPTGDINEANVTSAIERAGAIIEGHIGTRIAVPATATETLKNLAVDIALYTLFSRVENVPKFRGDRFALAMRFLKDVADGKVTIGASSAATDQYPQFSAPDADFGSDLWECY